MTVDEFAQKITNKLMSAPGDEEKVKIPIYEIFESEDEIATFNDSKKDYSKIWKSLGYNSCRFVDKRQNISFHRAPIIDDLQYDDYCSIKQNFSPQSNEYQISISDLLKNTSFISEISDYSKFKRIKDTIKCIWESKGYSFSGQTQNCTLKFKREAQKSNPELASITNQTGEVNQIIINRMYAGSFLFDTDTIGHEIINLMNSDDGCYYTYLNSQGTISVKYTEFNGKKSVMLLTRYYQKGIWEIVGKVENLETLKEMIITQKNSCWPRSHRFELVKNKYHVFYGQKNINDIMGKNKFRGKNDRHPFATFKGILYRPINPLFIICENNITMDNDKSVKVLKGLSNQSLRMFIDQENGSFNHLMEIICNDSNWSRSQDKINAMKAKKVDFNVFNLLGMETNELAYSNLLSYFLKNNDFTKIFIRDVLKLDSEFYEDTYQIVREEHNIDILLKGNNHIIVIENKIKSDINGRDKSKDDYIDMFFKDSEYKDKDEIKDLKQTLEQESNGDKPASQLTKYYYYSLYLAAISQYENGHEIPEENIERFVLIPEYQRNVIDKNHISRELYGEKYDIKTYKEILDAFSENKCKKCSFVNDKFFKEFKLGIELQSGDKDNHLEVELIEKLKKRIASI